MHANTWPHPLDDAWRADAACRTLDTSLFFPTAGELDVRAEAACERCTVAEACLTDALATGTYSSDGLGYRAGTDERQRYNIRRRNKRRAQAAS